MGKNMDSMRGETSFNRKAAACDGIVRSVDETEDKDLIYIIENTCMNCNKLMGKLDIKILPPSYIQDRDTYVRNGIVKRRIMCMQCYNEARHSSVSKVRFATSAKQPAIVKSAIRRFLLNR